MEENSTLFSTPLFEQHKKSGAKLAPFGGWLMPIQYTGIIQEHNWTRNFAGLFDICHMGEFMLQADLAKSNFNDLVTINLKDMPLKACRYGFMLNAQGGIIDDLLVYRIDQAEWMIVVNAATTAGDFAYLKKHLTGATRFENVSASLGKLDLQGPLAGAVLTELAGADITALQYYTFGYFNLLDEEIIISRTGYTGELGYELYMPNNKIAQLWQKILNDERVKPIGLGARDTLRLEIGYSLYGQDIDDKTTPIEAGLKYFISWDKEFVGKAVLLKQNQDGPSRRMVCFIADSRRSPRHNYRILHKGEDIGVVTSGSFSPSLGFGIGMGYVGRQIPLGDEIILKDAAISITAKVVNKPFYKNGTVKSKEINHVNT
ncbi:MAG: glycine cleavage system aminomethyltransferase GcvT [Candidatus Omnitrophica bacterium]|jgi:aminomethyltransferase|nr:glycine cleavage system aminomethyltransferase GcvT [Candidatus Omnitrophota bacterium]